MENELITVEEIETLDILFGHKRVWIETDETYENLSEIFDEDE